MFQPCSHSISKKGYSGIARFGKKVEVKDIYPSPLDYNTSTFPKLIHKSKYPFDSSSKRQTFVDNTTPGYNSNISRTVVTITVNCNSCYNHLLCIN